MLHRYSRAALCYEEAGRGQAAAEALSKGARAVEDSDAQVTAGLSRQDALWLETECACALPATRSDSSGVCRWHVGLDVLP